MNVIIYAIRTHEISIFMNEVEAFAAYAFTELPTVGDGLLCYARPASLIGPIT